MEGKRVLPKGAEAEPFRNVERLREVLEVVDALATVYPVLMRRPLVV